MRRSTRNSYKTKDFSTVPTITPIPKPNPIESLKQELLGQLSKGAKDTYGCKNVAMDCFGKMNTALNEQNTTFAQEHCNKNQPALCIIDDTFQASNNMTAGCGRYNANSYHYRPKGQTLYQRQLCHDSSEKVFECKSDRTSNQTFQSTQYFPVNGCILPVENYGQYQTVNYIEGCAKRVPERGPPEKTVQRSPSVSPLSENCNNLDRNRRMSSNEKDCSVRVSVRCDPKNCKKQRACALVEKCKVPYRRPSACGQVSNPPTCSSKYQSSENCGGNSTFRKIRSFIDPNCLYQELYSKNSLDYKKSVESVADSRSVGSEASLSSESRTPSISAVESSLSSMKSTSSQQSLTRIELSPVRQSKHNVKCYSELAANEAMCNSFYKEVRKKCSKPRLKSPPPPSPQPPAPPRKRRLTNSAICPRKNMKYHSPTCSLSSSSSSTGIIEKNTVFKNILNTTDKRLRRKRYPSKEAKCKCKHMKQITSDEEIKKNLSPFDNHLSISSKSTKVKIKKRLSDLSTIYEKTTTRKCATCTDRSEKKTFYENGLSSDKMVNSSSKCKNTVESSSSTTTNLWYNKSRDKNLKTKWKNEADCSDYRLSSKDASTPKSPSGDVLEKDVPQRSLTQNCAVCKNINSTTRETPLQSPTDSYSAIKNKNSFIRNSLLPDIIEAVDPKLTPTDSYSLLKNKDSFTQQHRSSQVLGQFVSKKSSADITFNALPTDDYPMVKNIDSITRDIPVQLPIISNISSNTRDLSSSKVVKSSLNEHHEIGRHQYENQGKLPEVHPKEFGCRRCSSEMLFKDNILFAKRLPLKELQFKAIDGCFEPESLLSFNIDNIINLENTTKKSKYDIKLQCYQTVLQNNNPYIDRSKEINRAVVSNSLPESDILKENSNTPKPPILSRMSQKTDLSKPIIQVSQIPLKHSLDLDATKSLNIFTQEERKWQREHDFQAEIHNAKTDRSKNTFQKWPCLEENCNEGLDSNTLAKIKSSNKDRSVRVAVRIRPQNPREIIDMCRICTTVTPGEPQIVLGRDKAFTFDCVFDVNSTQHEIYSSCVDRLVEGALCGYNATVLAYGQTGSGKTYTMGTGFDRNLNEQQQGIIPRAVSHIFSSIEEIQSRVIDGKVNGNVQFNVAAQFLELYNEDIVDLLDPYNKGRVFKIHEDGSGQISVSGATIKPIQGPQEALKCLQQGALARTTASTQMNDQSSRSHALFTILIKRQRIIPAEENDLCGGDLETLTSKFHFVDLAGSERLKRTGATGERAREGISINCGLLALGNCISALGDKSKKATHIPYRDSKLTRLLQDSLGGNSQTLMISCVSPSDRDFMETLNTLKYANRARNIKNKVQLNQDQSSRTISQMRREIAALQLELLEYKQGKRLIDCEGNSSLSDTFQENAMLLADNKRLQQRVKAMQETINILTGKNSHLLLEKEMHGWSPSVDSHSSEKDKIAGYLSEIEKLQAKSIELEEINRQFQVAGTVGNTTRSAIKRRADFDNPEDLINLAKRDLEKNRELLMSRSLPGFQEDRNNCNSITNANDSCDSDASETESDEKTYQIQADLNEINCDIELKTKLIEELELSQKRMDLMRHHYEEKLNVLNTKIVNTQKERDEILANMGTSQISQPKETVRKIRDEYESKLKELQRELKKLQQEQREHVRQRRDIQTQEVKLRTLRNELQELKCIKTVLMRKMAEQTSRHKEEESRKMREIAQLRKEQRRQQNAVKSLQAQMHVKDQVLKRKTEEVTALRRSQRSLLTEKAAGRVQSKGSSAPMKARSMRQRWDIMFRTITRASRNKQVIVQLEKELERLVDEREALGRDLGKIQNRQKLSQSVELDNEEDTIKSNLNYIQENIAHVQQAIMAFEEGKDSINNDAQCLPALIGNVQTVDEAKFLIEQLTDSVIAFSCNLSLAESRLLEQEALLKEVQHETSIQQQLLQHFLAQNNAVHISDLFDSLNLGITNQHSGSQNSLKSSGTYDIPFEGSMAALRAASQERSKSRSRSPSPAATSDISQDKVAKIRRRTAQPQDLLFGDREVSHSGDFFQNDATTRSFTQQETPTRNYHPLMRVPSAPGSLKQYPNSSSESKKSIEPSMIAAVPQSPRMAHRNIPSKGSPALDDNVTTGVLPQSPPVYRRNISREEFSNGSSDVFSRLGAGIQDPAPGGSIQKVTGKVRIGAPLYCTHTVLGHNSSVLSIKLDGDILYTASADRTVKIWDLSQETAQHCLSAHPGPVIAVQNDRTTQLLFSASGQFVRVWDLRISNTKPIKTLSSAGQVLSGNAGIVSMVPSDSPITALCLGSVGNLYVAASDKVRIWDLKSFTCVGKLSTGHQAAIMCITSWKGNHSGNTDFVATGSKDHYVKVFEVPRAGGVVCPLLNLEPPHYDGVQSLAATQNAVGADAELFSGSRDSGIKRWDLKSGELKQSLNNAHKGWVSGMAVSGDILLSGCRGGSVRLWNVNTCDSVAEMKTDLMINDIVASGQQVFTASRVILSHKTSKQVSIPQIMKWKIFYGLASQILKFDATETFFLTRVREMPNKKM